MAMTEYGLKSKVVVVSTSTIEFIASRVEAFFILLY